MESNRLILDEDSNCAENETLSSPTQLSPILNSSKSIRKILKSRQNKRKLSDSAILTNDIYTNNVNKSEVDKVENHEQPKDFSIKNVEEFKNAETIIERIKRLECLEEEKKTLVSLLSSEKVLLPTIHTTKCDNVQTELENSIEHNAFQEFIVDSSILVNSSDCVGFQTGRGQKITVSNETLQEHAKLFNDILNRNETCVRDNKFSYLKRNDTVHMDVSKTECEVSEITPGAGEFKPNSKTASRELFKTNETCTLKDESFSDIALLQEDEYDLLKEASESINKSKYVKKSETFMGNQEVKILEKAHNINKLSSSTRSVKNIFQGEILDDLTSNNFDGFRSAKVKLQNGELEFSRNASHISINSNFNVSKAQCEKQNKNIFLGEDSDDIKPKNFQKFKTGNVRPESSEANQIAMKNIFHGEILDDLGVNNFDSFKTANSRIVSEERSEKKHLLKINYCGKGRNIFHGETFNDLEPNNFEELKTANVREKSIEGHQEKEQLLKNKKVPTTNIFHEELFDDLKVNNFNGFKAASARLESDKVTERKQPLFERSNYEKPKNVFHGETFDDLKSNNLEGFNTASARLGNKETNKANEAILQQSHGQANFHDIGTNNYEVFNSANNTFISKQVNENDVDFDNKKSNPTIKTTHAGNQHQKPTNIFQGENFDDLCLSNLPGFSKGSKLKRPRNNIFEDENFDDLKVNAIPLQLHHKRTSFVSPYRPTLETNLENCSSINQFSGFNKNDSDIALCISKNYCKMISIIEERLDKLLIKKIQHPLILLNSLEKCCHEINVKTRVLLTTLGIKCIKQISKKRKASEQSDFTETSINNQAQQNSFSTSLNNPKRTRRRLGCHFSPTISIPQTEYSRAQHLFDDIMAKPINTSTPIKINQNIVNPLMCDLTPIQNKTISRSKNNDNSFMDDRTLIKQPTSQRLSLNKPSNENINHRLENLLSEKRLLEEKLKLINEKENILEQQRNALQHCNTKQNRCNIKTGILFGKKSIKGRLSLKDMQRGPIENSEIELVNLINPQNAQLVHFPVENPRLSHVTTLDGAIIVPNLDGRIGISEIEHSFKLIEGVDPKLIPENWVKNHFKWIVWKLASYERMLPQFQNCLTIENVVQQLKYRYDLEIDKVKRSAIRKILEKDDCAQKTMVLCVSKIVKNSESCELELTDGWYPIRTVIDNLLNEQINKGKIRLGVKLLVSCSELIGDGCFPLEAPESVHLKINYNSTRRAVWWSKLGFQKDIRPFPIPLSTVRLEGGQVGCLHSYIFRIYPICYMEKMGQRNVWRNKRAEERLIQKFESTKLKELEKIHVNFEPNQKRNYLTRNLKNIDDPEMLYELCNDQDPENLLELTSDQKEILDTFIKTKLAEQQQKLLDCMNVKQKMFKQRTVVSLLKIKLIDSGCKTDKCHDLHLWNPQDSYLQELKEGECISIYNISCSAKWKLSSNHRTQFKRERTLDPSKYIKFRRKVTHLKDLERFSPVIPTCNEFDTVGLPISRNTERYQELWLADCEENLLVVRIFDTPENVLIFDKIDIGRPVSVINLVFKESHKGYAEAIADRHSICSKYPESKILQSAITELEHELKSKEPKHLIERCKEKITQIKSPRVSSSFTNDIDEMDCSQMTATDLALLECFDKLL